MRAQVPVVYRRFSFRQKVLPQDMGGIEFPQLDASLLLWSPVGTNQYINDELENCLLSKRESDNLLVIGFWLLIRLVKYFCHYVSG
jgi:hypothetical protein